jgi:hypothetical protein
MTYAYFQSTLALKNVFKAKVHPYAKYNFTDNSYELGFCVFNKENRILGLFKSECLGIDSILIDANCDIYIQTLRDGFITFRTTDTRSNLIWKLNPKTKLAHVVEEYFE